MTWYSINKYFKDHATEDAKRKYKNLSQKKKYITDTLGMTLQFDRVLKHMSHVACVLQAHVCAKTQLFFSYDFFSSEVIRQKKANFQNRNQLLTLTLYCALYVNVSHHSEEGISVKLDATYTLSFAVIPDSKIANNHQRWSQCTYNIMISLFFIIIWISYNIYIYISLIIGIKFYQPWWQDIFIIIWYESYERKN